MIKIIIIVITTGGTLAIPASHQDPRVFMKIIMIMTCGLAITSRSRSGKGSRRRREVRRRSSRRIRSRNRMG